MTNQRRKLVRHREKTIIIHDYSGLEGDDYVIAVERNAAEADETSLKERLVLVDVSDSVVDKRVMKAFKGIARDGSSKIGKIAVVGATGLQHMFVSVIASLSKADIKPFDTREDAKDWLSS